MTVLNKEKILELARAMIEEGKFDKAIREYEKLQLADPSDLRVKLKIAELYTKRKQITEAIRIYREVADSYAGEGFYLKAVTVHKNILRLNPSLIEVNEQLAALYEKMGLVSDAIRQYDILATALEQRGMADRVLEIRSRIVKLNPGDGTARIRLAEKLQREGKEEEAISEYEEYAKQLEKDESKKPKLVEVLEKILVHRPDRQEMFTKLIDICAELGDNKKLIKWLEVGKDFVERDAKLLKLAGRLYSVQNQNETARVKYMQLAELLRSEGNLEGALDAYCEILALIPDEEDRLSKRIEEIKPGSLPGVLARAQKRREELLKEEELRHEANEKAKEEAREELKIGVRSGPIKYGAEKKQKEPPTKGEKAAPAQAAPKEAPPKTAEVAPVPAAAYNRKDGDAAYDLGVTYSRAGLAEEARAEFEKAKIIYLAVLESGLNDAEIEKRLAYIGSQL